NPRAITMSTIATGRSPTGSAVPGRRGDLLLALTLAVLAIALAGWQVEQWQWSDPGPTRLLMAAAVVLAYAGFIALLGKTRRRAAVAGKNGIAAGAAPDRDSFERDNAAGDWLVVHASQFGQAEELAQRTAESLQHAGRQVGLIALEQLDDVLLLNARRILFVASTTGEGDAPDPAVAFVDRYMARTDISLEHLGYAVLALGDSDYRQFCAF